MRWFIDHLIDLKVGHKLLLGFSLVLLLTVAVATGGWSSATEILRQADYLDRVAVLQQQILQLRLREKEHLLGEPESRDSVHAQLDRIATQLDALLAVRGSSKPDLAPLQQASTGYRQVFQSLRQAQGDAAAARTGMSIRADEARAQFETITMDQNQLLREELAETARPDAAALDLAEQTGDLLNRLLQLRSVEIQYSLGARTELAEEWQGLASGMAEAALLLRERLAPLQQAVLDEALGALTNYQESFTHFRQSLAAEALSRRQLAEQAQRMMEQAQRLHASEQQAMQQTGHSARLTLATITLVALALGLGGAWLIARLIVGPLRQCLTLAQRVAAGDLIEEQLSHRNDEVGQLLLALQTMRGNLRELIERIGASIALIATAAEQLSAVSEQTRDGAHTQAQETQQTASAMQQMAGSVQQVASDAAQASLAARQAEQQTRTGDRLVNEVMAQVRKLPEEIRHSSRTVGQVLDAIKGLAEQTNLLALNAAIEAARAGEQGRSFAVVADEVRALARRTRASTQEIERLLENLQNRLLQAVGRITGDAPGQAEAAGIDAAAQALLQINQAVSLIEHMNQQIADAAEQQSTAATQVSQSVQRVRGISEQNACATEQTAAASAELARLGAHLQVEVGRFRL